MGDYWDTYGTGDAWCDRFGNQVDPRTFPNEDSIRAAGYHHVNQAGARDWIARELGDVPVRVMGETCHDNPASWAGVLCESPGRDA